MCDAVGGDRLCPLPPFRSRNVRSLIGPPSAGQKVHRWTYLSMPFLHMSLGRSSFVERHRAKEEREVEERKGEGNGEIQRDTMPGINERVNKKQRARGQTKREKGEIESEGERAGRRPKTGARRPVCRGVSAFCGRQMTVAYLPEPAAILLRSELRRRPNARRKK
ncbi:hypothetical protein ALC57_17807 [Trachymyrmex cornetzi]|uniref:Uncharacterized protein n=1 Tax=Trachymyrmex cornetzi TaxID=471704 RepID=A0A195DB90_9HYME|nr:hypothetical protein ALC57_17807 [Trachymyrmex cornetzi]